MAEIVKAADKISNVRDLLTKMVPQLALAVGHDVTAKRLARIATSSVLRNPKLLDADPKTLAGAVMECAQLGLEPDGREAHLVPFKNSKRGVLEVQLIPDYKGLAKLARNSSRVKTLDWRAVYKGDKFTYQYGSSAKLDHVPSDAPIHSWVAKDPKKPDGDHQWIEREITHAYALAVLDGGEAVFEVMKVEDIEWHRDQYSRAAGDGPWVTNFDDMAAKTCFRKLAKKLPRASTDDRLGRAVELDEHAQQGIPQSLGTDLIGGTDDDGAGETGPPTPGADVEAPSKSGKLDTLTGELKKNGKNGKAPAPAATAEAGSTSAISSSAPAASRATSPPGAGNGPAAATPTVPSAATESTPTPAPPKQETGPGDAGGTSPSAATTEAASSPSTSGGPGRPAAAEPSPRAVMVDPARAPILARIGKAFESLGMDTDQKKPQRDFLYTRYLGAGVKPVDGAPEKLEALAVELERLVTLKKK